MESGETVLPKFGRDDNDVWETRGRNLYFSGRLPAGGEFLGHPDPRGLGRPQTTVCERPCFVTRHVDGHRGGVSGCRVGSRPLTSLTCFPSGSLL